MAEDDDAWSKLPSFDKVQHANWKCRKAGYEELIKSLPTLGMIETIIMKLGKSKERF